MRHLIGIFLLVPLVLLIAAPGDQPRPAVPRLGASNDAHLDAVMSSIEYTDLSSLQRALAGCEAARLNGRDRNGLTPLTRAARIGWVEGVGELLDRGAGVDVPDDYGRTPLYLTMNIAPPASGHIFDLLLRHGADVNASCRGGQTAVVCAAWGRRADLLHRLIAAGADVNIAPQTGFTALHTAAANDDAQCVNLLLAAGARADARDDERKTPLDVARERGSSTVASLLSTNIHP